MSDSNEAKTALDSVIAAACTAELIAKMNLENPELAEAHVWQIGETLRHMASNLQRAYVVLGESINAK